MNLIHGKTIMKQFIKKVLSLIVALVIFGAPTVFAGECTDGVSAICRDGTTSRSRSRSGTCSRHGGVDRWCPEAPTGNRGNSSGSSSKSKNAQRAQQSTGARTVKGSKLVGWVSAVHDGDTITLLKDKKQYKIRLAGIDCPELKQPFGTKARQFAANLTFNKNATIFVDDIDRYGRVVGWVFVGQTNVNLELVKAGYAWWYRQYARENTKLANAEASARKAKRGLWRDARAVAPWDWRKGRR